jgi:hypothetical protein
MTASPAEQTRRMQALVSERWRLEGPRVENHVGDLAWMRFQHVGREPEWRIRLWEEDGAPIAWAWLRPSGKLLHEIHPRHRGDELHRELLDWFEAEAEDEEVHRRRGLASAVCCFALRRLHEEGAERGIVYSLAGSAATALYESIGMREHARSLELVKSR